MLSFETDNIRIKIRVKLFSYQIIIEREIIIGLLISDVIELIRVFILLLLINIIY